VIVSRSPRWREHRARFVGDREAVDHSAYAVDMVEQRTARAFVEQYHYLGSWPAAQLAVGLLDDRPGVRDRLVGIAVFAVPSAPAVITRDTGLESRAGDYACPLRPARPCPAERRDFFLARAVRLLRRKRPALRPWSPTPIRRPAMWGRSTPRCRAAIAAVPRLAARSGSAR
jgi:hypothetical protein